MFYYINLMAQLWDEEYRQIKMIKHFNIYNEELYQYNNNTNNTNRDYYQMNDIDELPDSDYFE